MKLGNNEKKSGSVEIKKSLKSGKKWLAVTMFSLTGSILLMGASTVSVNAETVLGDTTTNQPTNDSSEAESTFTYDKKSQTLTISAGKLPQSTIAASYPDVKKDVKTIVFTGPTTAPESMNSYFSGLKQLESIERLDKLNTSNVTDMSYMFSDCNQLQDLDVSKLDTSSVINMGFMFEGDAALKGINLSSFNTENVKVFISMFEGTNIEDLDLSKFVFGQASNVTDMLSSIDGIRSITLSKDSKINDSGLSYTRKDIIDSSSGLTSKITGWHVVNSDEYNEVISSNTLLSKYDGSDSAPSGTLTWTVKAVPIVKLSIKYVDYDTGDQIATRDADSKLQGQEGTNLYYGEEATTAWKATNTPGYDLDKVFLGNKEGDRELNDADTVLLPSYSTTLNGTHEITLYVKKLAPLTITLNLPNEESAQFYVSLQPGIDQADFNEKKDSDNWNKIQSFYDTVVNISKSVIPVGGKDYPLSKVFDFEKDKLPLRDVIGTIQKFNYNQFQMSEFNLKLVYEPTIPDENNNGGNTGGGNHNNGNHNNGGNNNNNNDNNNDNNEDKTPGETVVADKHQTLGTFANGSVVKLYDNNGKEVTSRALAQNTAWQSDKTMTLNDELYYRVSSTEWVKASDVYTYTAHQSRVKVRPNTIAKLVTADNKPVSRGLMESSGWITDLYIMINNEKYYRVSTNEFVSAADVGEY